MRVRGYISCVLGCPYEGEIDAGRRCATSRRALHAMGCYEVSLGDTIGTGTAGQDAGADRDASPSACRSARSPDTFTTPTARRSTNVYAAMEVGVATFDCSVAGLGGCPYAKGATGNVASEDVLYLLEGLGIETGVDMTRLRVAGRYISDFLGRAAGVARRARARRQAAAAGMTS